MTEHVFKNQAGLAKTGDRMRAQTAPISFHTTLRNPKKFRPKRRNEIEEHRDVEIDFPSKPNLNQVTKSLDTSHNRFRLAVKQFLENMRKSDHDVRCFLVIGCLHMKRGLLKDAIGYFQTGLRIKGITDEEKVALFFQLGRANEKLKNFSEAIYFYYRVHLMNPDYLSVTRRLLDMAELYEATNE